MPTPWEKKVIYHEASAGGEANVLPVEAARAFLAAVAWGEHLRVWEMLSKEGRLSVLAIAENRGMDSLLAARLREGTAGQDELDGFLTELIAGLREDLSAVDLEELSVRLDDRGVAVTGEVSMSPQLAVRVVLEALLPQALGGAVPAGVLVLSCSGDRWLVDRLVPAMGERVQRRRGPSRLGFEGSGGYRAGGLDDLGAHKDGWGVDS